MVRTTGGDAARRLMATRHDKISKIAEGCDKGRHVSKCGGIEHAIDPCRFAAGLDHTHLLENDLGTFGGVELDRQSDQLEYGKHGVANDAERNQATDLENEATDDDQRQDLGGELRDRDNGHAPFERGVRAGMLDGVTRFMGRDTQCGHTRRMVNIGRKTEAFLHRIVMVAEHVVDFPDFDIVDFSGIEDLAGSLRTGHAGGGSHLFVAAESGRHPHLGVEAEGERDTDEEKVNGHIHGRCGITR